MRGLIQLPNYLDHLALDYPDMPLALLHSINRLRALRKQQALPANHLFTPDVHAPLGLKPAPHLPDAKLKDYLNKMRAAYHKGLTVWLKGPNRGEGLKTVYTVMDKTLQATGNAPISRAFWITEALIEAIFQKGLPGNEAITNLLKQLDPLYKQIVEHGNAGLRVWPPHKMLNSQLYYVAHAKSKGPKVTAVKQAFHLDHYLPSTAQVQSAEQIFSGPDIELMSTVVASMKDDVTRVEETLDIFQRADNPDISDLLPLVEIMHNMAYTLSLLGLDVQASSMMEQKKTIHAVGSGEQEYDLSKLLNIANALLKINGALETLGSRGVHARQQIQKEAGLHETQYKAVLRATVDEAKNDLAEVVQPIITFMDSGSVDEDLMAIPERLHGIRGLLQIMNQARAEKLMSHCGAYIDKHLIKEAKVPEEKARKALADALVSFEFYLETLAGNPMDGNRILDVTEKALHTLFPARAAA